MHGDSAASDTTPFRGPGTAPAGGLPVRTIALGAACPAVLVGRSPRPLALCTRQTDRAPVVHLLDPDGRGSLASLALPTGNLFGGVYTYLDERDRMVLVSGDGRLLRIAGERAGSGWTVRIVADADLAPALAARCGGGLCGGVVGITPDWRGRVWLATAEGLVGIVDPATNRVRTARLGAGEAVANSIASGPHATAVATTRALYELDVDDHGAPRILWRAPYARGPYRKPGQLSHGTGSTPTYFGPVHGTEHLAIVDDATPRSNLLVYDALASRRDREPRPICRIPILEADNSGSENSPIGSGRTVIVASTYGYPYPAYPDDAGPIAPDARDGRFAGGMTRIDVAADGRGCREVWRTRLRSAAVPKLSLPDGLLYTVLRTPALGLAPPATTPLDGFAFTAVDLATGARRGAATPLGTGLLSDALQLAGNADPRGGVYWQGSISGIWRIGAGDRPAAPAAAVGTLEPDAANCTGEAEELTRCAASRIALTEVRRVGARTVVRGAVAPGDEREPVRIVRRIGDGRGTAVTTVVPDRDGRFSVRPVTRSRGSVRWRAVGSRGATAWIVDRRGIALDAASGDGRRVAVRGRLAGAPGTTAVRLQRRTSCGPWHTVARARADRRGRFRLRIAAPTERDALLLRATARIAGRTARTLPVAVRPR